MKVLSALVHAFCAWSACALLVFAGPSRLAPAPQTAWRCACVVFCFGAVFRLYYREPGRLPPAATGLLAVGLVAALDVLVFSPYSLHPYDVLLDSRDWQLPGACALAAVCAAGRRGP